MTTQDAIGSLQDLLQKSVTIITTNCATIQWQGRLEQIGEYRGVPVLGIRPPRKRKLEYIPLTREVLVFEGESPVQRDADIRIDIGNGMTVSKSSGNCCINLVGDVATVRAAVEQRNRNPLFVAKELILALSLDPATQEWIETPAWPEEPLLQSHAPLEGIRARYQTTLRDEKELSTVS